MADLVPFRPSSGLTMAEVSRENPYNGVWKVQQGWACISCKGLAYRKKIFPHPWQCGSCGRLASGADPKFFVRKAA
jgi:ribosomal protein L37AE/L43A